MSNLSRLEAVADGLDTAIATANSLPEAGGGGGSVETCTLELSTDTGFNVINYSTTDSDENIVSQRLIQPYEQNLSLTVVCGTLVHVLLAVDSSMTLSNASVRYNIDAIKVFSIDAQNGETASATFIGSVS